MRVGPGADTDEPNDALVAYVTGQGPIPVPTYFIGGFGEQLRKRCNQPPMVLGLPDCYWSGRTTLAAANLPLRSTYPTRASMVSGTAPTSSPPPRFVGWLQFMRLSSVGSGAEPSLFPRRPPPALS